tara:strand:- start:311 stop:715 length:405 start_codon:yes stop_codon:yes gene_type:complete
VVAILLATLNLAIPSLDENTTVQIEEPPKRFLQFIEYEEPPTKQQYMIYWGLNALDVYTTYRALKKPNIIEGNPLLGSNPSRDKLILFKVLGASLVGNNLDSDMMTGANATLTYIVYRNYKVMNKASDQLKNNN